MDKSSLAPVHHNGNNKINNLEWERFAFPVAPGM